MQQEESHIELEKIVIINNFGRVNKHDFKKELGCTSTHEWTTTIQLLEEMDKDFKKEYQRFRKTWHISESIALQITNHLFPGHPIEVTRKRN